MIPLWALTGGAKAGKSTAIREIKRLFGKQVIVVREAATDLFSEGYPQPGRDCEFSSEWIEAFQWHVLKRQRELEAEAIAEAESSSASLIICDRGILDGAAYAGGLTRFCEWYGVDSMVERTRYERIIHLESVATCKPHLFDAEGNGCRYETLEAAQELELATREAWNHHPNWQFYSGTEPLESTITAICDQIFEMLAVEIERKWHFTGNLPELDEKLEIEQGYLINTPEAELRIRMANATPYLTRKGKGTLIRREIEEVLTPWVYAELRQLTVGERIHKDRYYVRCKGAKQEQLAIDIYKDGLAGLVILEAEFHSPEQSAVFSLPDWAEAAVEVTDDPAYKNKNLSRSGLPM